MLYPFFHWAGSGEILTVEIRELKPPFVASSMTPWKNNSQAKSVKDMRGVPEIQGTLKKAQCRQRGDKHGGLELGPPMWQAVQAQKGKVSAQGI